MCLKHGSEHLPETCCRLSLPNSSSGLCTLDVLGLQAIAMGTLECSIPRPLLSEVTLLGR